MMDALIEERFARLESKLALTEDTVDTLNMTVYRQQKQIERLQAQILDLQNRLSSFAPDGRRDLRDEIPPHY